MAKPNSTITPADSKVAGASTATHPVRTYPLRDYGSVIVDKSNATDFAHRRAQQLYSMLAITQGESDFHSWNDEIKDGVIGLAIDIAHDLKCLIPFVQDDGIAYAKRGVQ